MMEGEMSAGRGDGSVTEIWPPYINIHTFLAAPLTRECVNVDMCQTSNQRKRDDPYTKQIAYKPVAGGPASSSG